MAESVEELIERMVPALHDLVQKKIFSEKEIKKIIKKRKDFEYTLRSTADWGRVLHGAMSRCTHSPANWAGGVWVFWRFNELGQMTAKISLHAFPQVPHFRTLRLSAKFRRVSKRIFSQQR